LSAYCTQTVLSNLFVLYILMFVLCRLRHVNDLHKRTQKADRDGGNLVIKMLFVTSTY